MRFEWHFSNSSNLDMLKHSGPMVSALVSGLSDLDLSPGQGVCVVFLTRHFTQSASLHPGVEIGTGEFNVGGEGGNPAMDLHPI